MSPRQFFSLCHQTFYSNSTSKKPKIQAESTPMEWVRGERIGHGSFGNVNLAIPRSHKPQIPSLMAVKSCGVSHFVSLMNEKLILDELRHYPQIVQCFGDSFTLENGENLYNVLLEYASGGSLADNIKNSVNGQLPEFEVQRYTKSILKGLYSIHKNGYVHCDIKLQNVLLFPSKIGGNDMVKIADFGLAKKAGEQNSGCELRGTPMYMSPEMVAGGEQESPADIWALGCLVVEMVTGAPAWRCRQESDFGGLFMRIGVGEEVPEIPGKLSQEGKDFLGRCLLKDPRHRWTAEMLLSHPFVANFDDDFETVILKQRNDVPSTSPRSAFEFPDWVSEQSSEITSLSSPEYTRELSSWVGFDLESISSCGSSSISPADRLHQLVTDHRRPDWSVNEDSWITVRP